MKNVRIAGMLMLAYVIFFSTTVAAFSAEKALFVPWALDNPNAYVMQALNKYGFEIVLQPSVPSDLSSYRLVILESYAASNRTAADYIKDFVQNGGGAIIFSGCPNLLAGSPDLSYIRDWFGGWNYGNDGGYAYVSFDHPFGTDLLTGDIVGHADPPWAGAIYNLDPDSTLIARWPLHGSVASFIHSYGQGRVFFMGNGVGGYDPPFTEEQLANNVELFEGGLLWAANYTPPPPPTCEGGSLTWAKTYNVGNVDRILSIQQTADGGYAAVGRINPDGGYMWLAKLDELGDIQWQKAYSGAGDTGGYGFQQTSDGGYIISGHRGWSSAWVVKLNAAGGVEWQKTFARGSFSWINSVEQTGDGGYILLGPVGSWDGGSGYDIWVAKLDQGGDVQWEKPFSGISNVAWSDYFTTIHQTTDGGYILSGQIYSDATGYEAVVVKLHPDGTIQWQKAYGGPSNDKIEGYYGNRIQQTRDGGYIVGANTNSFGASNRDAWVLKLDQDGIVQWEKKYGAAGNDILISIRQTGDDGYIIAGATDSSGAGGEDIWVFKIDPEGQIQWQKTYGGAASEDAYEVRQTTDGGYVVISETLSFGGGWSDALILKLDSTGNLGGCSGLSIGVSNAVAGDTNANVTNPNISPVYYSLTPQTTYVGVVETYVVPNALCPVTCNQTYTVTASVAGDPSGLQIGVDGVNYAAPKTFEWGLNENHMISVASPQDGPSGTRFVFNSWSDGGSQAHNISTSEAVTSYVASFDTQYSLTVLVNLPVGGTVNPSGTNWYASGQTVSVQAFPAAGYYFTGWSGDQTGSQNPISVVLTGPNTLTANFERISLSGTSPASLWIGLKNSDDQGTQFDLKAELYINGNLVTEGQTLCITGVTRNPSYAKQVTVPFGPVSNGAYNPGDVLSLKVSTRIGTTPDGQKCAGPGGSHNNAVGLRLYYDAATRASAFGGQIAPDPLKTYFLHSSGSRYFLDNVAPSGSEKYKDSAGINYNNGNPWKEIGTWSMTLP